MNILEVGFRIKQGIGLTGYNVKEFCERTNRSRVTTALWIAGHGGLIKDKSLEELCSDLKKCAVSCSTRWLKYGEGTPPTLCVREPVEYSAPELRLNNLNIHVDDLLLHLKKCDSDNYFEFNDEHFYAIATYSHLNKVKSSNAVLLLILSDQRGMIGRVGGLCTDTDTLVLFTLDNAVVCINKQDIQKIGKVSVYLRKNSV